ncbi:hypothetical protein BO224_03040 [Erysipelotrichaceae bacterium NYU-BL-E8]|uniref:Uncharacterized protein n=1 Tax=Ileibacterium valens TaxID=1862668 RepID=A0A1U7NGF1_9FIRM|nr:hypothetical protein BO222_05870 [Ileibacterium valens]OLU41750.1 hypothetical protein BO224_03040 [Erysipelotrichaceae bacterium NYU-BL-E8]
MKIPSFHLYRQFKTEFHWKSCQTNLSFHNKPIVSIDRDGEQNSSAKSKSAFHFAFDPFSLEG